MCEYESILKTYDYLITRAIKHLKLDTKEQEFFAVGKVALLIAYETYNGHYGSFPLYAYYTILNHFKNELVSISKYLKLQIGLELYQNNYLAPLMEHELLIRLYRENLISLLSPIQQEIVKLINQGWSKDKVSYLLSLKPEDIDREISQALTKVYAYCEQENL